MPIIHARKSITADVVELTVWQTTTAPSLSGRRGKEGEAKLKLWI
jgi:hypothetical protein